MTDPTPLPSVKDYVIDVAERAVRTFFQTLAAYFGAGALDLLHADWTHALDLSAGAAVLSIVTSMAAAPFGEGGTASLTRAVVPRSLVGKLRAQVAAIYGRHAAQPPDRLDGWPGVLNTTTAQEEPRVTARSYIRRPNAVTQSLKATQVATAYGFDAIKATGKGVTVGVVELGGAVNASDLQALGMAAVKVVSVDGSHPKSDGPNDADGEVMLDVEVIAAVAPGAKIRVYFAPNTDAGFLDAIKQATAECDVVSISWGGPEDSWSPSTIDAYDQVFAAAKTAGVNVFCAAGDAGSGDGESGKHVDFPASSPHVIGCGGTRLEVNPDGSRAAETVWNDGPSSAGGGGVSVHFPGRDVPDVAGCADPVTGYQIRIDGGAYVIGGTSAVAPLYAALCARLIEASGARFDFMAAVLEHPEVCFDVTSGSNGAFRAGPGRDEATGFGVVDGGRLLATLPAVPPAPAPGPAPAPTGFPLAAWEAFSQHPYSRPKERTAIAAVNAWLNGGGS
ncbi:MAG TPA: holin [Acidimicrobiales bacterium]|nr:holin [Acidimicrobiales bacterium]